MPSINHPTPITTEFALDYVDPSWRTALHTALQQLEPTYLYHLLEDNAWLPGHQLIFKAFTQPVDQIQYVLFGESPYPRATSANGYAFWDQAVGDLWAPTGLSKPVNRATSLRNIMKMLLVANGMLSPKDTSQTAIAKLDKSKLIQTNAQLFERLIQHGFLLVNASPVLQKTPVRLDARAWKPFVKAILNYLCTQRPNITFVLLGNIANEIKPLLTEQITNVFYAEHPYNLSFITNPKVLDFFRPFNLLNA